MAERKRAQAESTASATWSGGLTDGSGRITESGSAAFGDLPVSWAARTGEKNGQTSPEELLAAAHAACYAMALSYELQGRQTPPERLDVGARVGFDPKVGGGFAVSFSELTVRARVPGIDAAEFEEAAQQAGVGCPISAALKDNVAVTVNASLEG